MVALPPPRHGESAAADLAASHTGLSIPVLPIEGVPVYASAINTGALTVFTRADAEPGDPGSLARRCCLRLQDAPDQFGVCLLKTLLTFKYWSLKARAAGFPPALGSVV